MYSHHSRLGRYAQAHKYLHTPVRTLQTSNGTVSHMDTGHQENQPFLLTLRPERREKKGDGKGEEMSHTLYQASRSMSSESQKVNR